MKKIYIKHLGKTEGHNSFFGKLCNGNIAEARLETLEGARLMEAVLNGRHYSDVPIITARICGICPVVHNLTSIKAVEDAFGIKIPKNIVILRKIMELCQVIHSHTLHLFFLSLPDFFDISDDLEFVKKFQKEAKLMIEVREFAISLLEIIAGRIVHPINSEVGGFRTAPNFNEIMDKYKNIDEVIIKAVKFFDFIKKIKYPKFERKTDYICLASDYEYAIYEGSIKDAKGNKFNVRQFMSLLGEYQNIDEVVKKVKYNNQSYMVGAIARLNNNYSMLNPIASQELKKAKINIPTYNSFHNILAQGIETIHCVEEIKKLIPQILSLKNKKVHISVVPSPGIGIASVEAPRGTLYHHYQFNKDGNLIKANIITPTAMFLGNLDEDLKEYLNNVKHLKNSERNRLIKALIRSYDPCISCATH